MVFIREMKLPLDILSENITEKFELRTDYAKNLKNRLIDTHDFVNAYTNLLKDKTNSMIEMSKRKIIKWETWYGETRK